MGYWDGPEAAGGLPDVCDFVSTDENPDEARAVAAYLRAGAVFAVALGVSVCRLCGSLNGSGEQTDGENFVWPQGLAHYVEKHGVRLPSDVVAVAMHGSVLPVDLERFEDELLSTGETTIDAGWWHSLAQTTGRAPTADTQISHLLGCRRNLREASWNLPTKADIYVDHIPSGSIATLAGVRRLLGLAWPLSGLRNLLATQPFLTVEAGNPRTLRHALISAQQLQPHLFYSTSGGLRPVWTER
ncbi:hypothetical protein Asi03nite_74650 [Actinoplanes siamensis]|uniref:Uncharacterized protein n=2 Tax=Actinoplanes siamensis TaxID=1223317 RepID=A0A919NEQ6_9ACTN|nr:hypothetical protein Asi03nite_74650 [Actinoplanes siamensis]